MDNKLLKIIELNRDPMLAAEEERICCMNTAAKELFPNVEPGCNARILLPEHILLEPSESFLTSILVDGRSYSVSACRDGNTLLVSLAAGKSAAELRGCFSDSLLSGMMSALFNIQLSAERLSAKLDPEDTEARKYCAAFYHNYYSLNHRLSNMNTLCSLSDNSMSVVYRCVDLATFCRDLVASTNLIVGDEHPKIEFSCSAESLPACVDTPKVEQLILNLLSNALRYTPKGGTTRLRLAKSGSSAVISVDDSGCGISPELLKNIFSSYEKRLDERRLTDPGSGGLGLGICRCIAEKHGGAMILESRMGAGTSVRVLLPLHHPGETVLRTDSADYENGGMRVLLSELCDVLDLRSYGPDWLT